jgi:hypothetical protein
MQDSGTKQPTAKEVQASGHAPAVPGGEAAQGHLEDINVRLVAVTVGCFVVALAVLIGALEVGYRRASLREQEAKFLPQEDLRTDLGKLLAAQRAELHEGLDPTRVIATTTAPATGTAPATAAASQPARRWISIDNAMRVVAREYQGKDGGL